jgi:glycosyltransferase involved in cell wall biosynthesis
LAAAIIDLLGHPEQISAFGHASRQAAEEKFGMDEFVLAYEKLLSSAVTSNKA